MWPALAGAAGPERNGPRILVHLNHHDAATLLSIST
jgi:hypothetical protein